MKNLFLASLLLSSIICRAQVPPAINYQAVARNAQGTVLDSQQIVIRLTIRDSVENGNISYQETDNVTTNQFGLFTVLIGQGSVTAGSFASINWAGGSEFLQVELNPGTGAFSDMGNTQLVSVPYALYAGNSNPGPTGPIGPTGPRGIAGATGIDGAAGPGYSATSVSNATLGLGIQNFVTQLGLAYLPNDRVRISFDGTNYMEGLVQSYIGTILVINVDRIIGNGTYTQWNIGLTGDVGVTGTTGPQGPTGNTGATGIGGFVHNIGDLYGGGIVVAVWDSAGTQHGLIASLQDIGISLWSNDTTTQIGYGSPQNGKANTASIIAQAGEVSSAAQMCALYNAGGFTDWYLPALWELEYCYKAAFIVNRILGDDNGFQVAHYWTSGEFFGNNTAWYVYFADGSAVNVSKGNIYNVRAVRSF